MISDLIPCGRDPVEYIQRLRECRAEDEKALYENKRKIESLERELALAKEVVENKTALIKRYNIELADIYYRMGYEGEWKR